MQFEQLKTPSGAVMQGPLLITPQAFGDERGWFFESWNQRKFDDAAGEAAVQSICGAGGRGLILRTSWVIGPVGKNFALTMLRLHREQDQLGVVADQVGCPTSTLNLAMACWRSLEVAAERELPAVMQWSDAGAASWYDVAVGRIGAELGLIDKPTEVQPITTAEYPTPAKRPAYSLLDCTRTRAALELEGEHWQQALKAVLQQAKTP